MAAIAVGEARDTMRCTGVLRFSLPCGEICQRYHSEWKLTRYRMPTLASNLIPSRTELTHPDLSSSMRVIGLDGFMRPWSIQLCSRSKFTVDISSENLLKKLDQSLPQIRGNAMWIVQVLESPFAMHNRQRLLTSFKAIRDFSFLFLTTMATTRCFAFARARTSTSSYPFVVCAWVIGECWKDRSRTELNALGRGTYRERQWSRSCIWKDIEYRTYSTGHVGRVWNGVVQTLNAERKMLRVFRRRLVSIPGVYARSNQTQGWDILTRLTENFASSGVIDRYNTWTREKLLSDHYGVAI